MTHLTSVLWPAWVNAARHSELALLRLVILTECTSTLLLSSNSNTWGNDWISNNFGKLGVAVSKKVVTFVVPIML